MIVLGIETSCDETAAAVVADDRRVLAEAVLSQLAEHRPYGGVVPEIAARSHLDHLDSLIRRAMAEAGLGFGDLAGIAATGGPGLIGGVMVGVMTAKAIAAVAGKPFIAVNHLEGHALTARLTDDLAFPFLLLLVSGGHCQLLLVEGVGRHRRLGTTIDDAAGEAFDKAAKMLGLGYPGGPALERAAAAGDPRRIPAAPPDAGAAGRDFSFSGLKTALRHRLAEAELREAGRDVSADLAASFQAAVIDCLADRTAHGIAMAKALAPGDRPGRGRRRGRQYQAARAAGRGRRGRRPAARRPAGQILHRQCRDDRLGRDRAAAPRPHRRPRLRPPAALAPGSDGEARGPRISDNEARA